MPRSNKYNGSYLLKDLNEDVTAKDISMCCEIRCDGGFKNVLRMNLSNFEYLLGVIGHKIGKRDASPAREKL